ncbi:MAG TPA: glucosaminidase domain-containing protein [Candidatus Saccharimonadales bacterium]
MQPYNRFSYIRQPRNLPLHTATVTKQESHPKMSECIDTAAAQQAATPDIHRAPVPHYPRVLSFVAAVATIAGLAEGCSGAAPPPDTCTDSAHELVVEGGAGQIDWASQATLFSTDRPYLISAPRLKAANPALTPPNDTVKQGQRVCFTLPGPVVAGYEEANGMQSLGQMAAGDHESVLDLFDSNPSLPEDPKYVPGAGMLISTSTPTNPVNNNLFEQASPYDSLAAIGSASGMTRQELDEIIQSNDAAITSKNGIQKGTPLFLPPHTTPYMQAHHITLAGIREAFHDATPIPASQTATAPASSPPTAPPTSTEADPPSGQLNARQLQMIEALGLPPAKQQFLTKVLTLVSAQTQAGYPWNTAAVTGMAILESNWGTSKIAVEGDNLFGVKAGSSWSGPYMKVDGTEQESNGAYTKLTPMDWRKYSSYGAAVLDLENVFNQPWAQDALLCSGTSLGFLNGIEYELNQSCAVLPGQAYPGKLQSAFATDRNYVKDILRVVVDDKLPAIISAGD